MAAVSTRVSLGGGVFSQTTRDIHTCRERVSEGGDRLPVRAAVPALVNSPDADRPASSHKFKGEREPGQPALLVNRVFA